MRKIKYIMFILICIVSTLTIKVNAKTIYTNSYNFANNYIKRFTKYQRYIVTESQKYGFASKTIIYDSNFYTGGLLNKEEFEISNSIENKVSYLENGLEFFTMSKTGSNVYTISPTSNGYISSKGTNERSGIRVTNYAQSTAKVKGNGTLINPWEFIEVNYVEFSYDHTKLSINPDSVMVPETGVVIVDVTPLYGFAYASNNCGATYENNKLYLYNVTKDITCRVEAADLRHTLTANANSGTLSSATGWTINGSNGTKTIIYGEKIGTLPNATRTGYTLVGWFTETTGGTQITENTIAREDLTIYARWKDATPPVITLGKRSVTYSDFSDWTLSGNATVSSGVLTIPDLNSSAYNYYRSYNDVKWDSNYQFIIPSYNGDSSTKVLESFDYYDNSLNAISDGTGWRQARTQHGEENTWTDGKIEHQTATTAYYTKNTFYWNNSYVKALFKIRNYKFFTDNDVSSQGKIVTVSATDNDSGVKTIKYLSGTKTVNDFASSGTDITSKKYFETTTAGTYTVYAEDNLGNKAVETISVSNIDRTSPTATITGGTTLKATSQTVTLKCSDTVGVVGYYWGTTEVKRAAQLNTTTDLSSLTGSGLSKTISSAGTYYLGCKDAAGNFTSKSITIRSYKIQHVLEKVDGTTGTYTSTNYENSGNVSSTYYVKNGTTMTLSSLYTTPTGGGTFQGYTNSAPSSTSQIPKNINEAILSNNLTYYMWFDRSKKSLTLNKGNCSSVSGAGTYKYGKSVSISAGVPDGYTFEKWTVGSGNTPASTTTNSTTVTITQATTLTASCKAKTYTANLNWNLFYTTTGTQNGVTKNYNSTLQIVELNGTLTTTNFDFGKILNISLTSGDKYTVNLKYVSGSYSATSERKYFVFEAQKDGSNISGRTVNTHYINRTPPTSGNNSGTLTVTDAIAGSNSNNWRYWFYQSTANGITFTNYKMQVLVTKDTSKTVTYGSTYGTLTTPTKTGYTFNGWYTALDGGTKITSSSTVSTASNHTLYAHWTPKTYTLTYNNNSGSGCTSKTGTYNSTWGTLCTPTRSNYTFSGWYTSASGGTKITASTVVAGNKTVYAHWTEDSTCQCNFMTRFTGYIYCYYDSPDYGGLTGKPFWTAYYPGWCNDVENDAVKVVCSAHGDGKYNSKSYTTEGKKQYKCNCGEWQNTDCR